MEQALEHNLKVHQSSTLHVGEVNLKGLHSQIEQINGPQNGELGGFLLIYVEKCCNSADSGAAKWYRYNVHVKVSCL